MSLLSFDHDFDRTAWGRKTIKGDNGREINSPSALEYNIPYTTTLAAAKATLHAIRTLKEGKLEVRK